VSALAGLRVLEMGQLIAGPFCGSMLAGHGADVVKIEPPGTGDPLRRWRMLHEGTSLWWRSIARNKRSVTVDLRRREGQDLVRRLVVEGHVDVVVENFRPGRLEAWGLGFEALRAEAPRLIMARISGWGQDGPMRTQPGFANIAESAGGLRHLTGEPGRAPVRSGLSLGDTLAGLHAAFGVLAAVYQRDVVGSGQGQLVDVALSESVFNMLESTLPEYAVFGRVRERTGSALEGIAPTNTYPCLDDRFVVIGANSDSMFARLMRAIGRADLAEDPDLGGNDGRVARAGELDGVIAGWTRTRKRDDVIEALRTAEVAVGPIQDIAEIAADPQFVARGMFEAHNLPGGTPLTLPGWVPRMERTPGETRWIGPELGAHNDEVLGNWLGLDVDRRAELAADGVI